MIYNQKFETMPREELEQLQIERLQSSLNRVGRNVDFYRDAFERNGIDIEKIRSIKDIKDLPFTTKEDLRKSYPYGMFAVPLRDIVRIHSTAGRTGRPIAIGYTSNDVQNWSEQVARVLAAAGVSDHDFVQIAFDYNMFTGGFGLHYGAERLGASVIPSSQTSSMERQVHIMKDYKSTVLLSTPSYALGIAGNLRGLGIHPEELNLKTGLFGAEPWGEATRARIEEGLRIAAYNIYGVNEMMGPGVSGECTEKNGLHVNEDHYIVEIVDPKSGAPLPDGAEGELVITTITREGFPLVRYRTGDLSSLMEGVCPCGRTTRRMRRVSARTDDMVAVNGINIFPAQIREVLKRDRGIEPDFQIVIGNSGVSDTVELRVVVSDTMFNDEVKKLLDMRSGMTETLERELGMAVKVTFVEQDTLRAEQGGSCRLVVDTR